MDQVRRKYQRRNINTKENDKDKPQLKINNTRLNHSFDESKYENPKKSAETKVEIGKEFSRKRIDNKANNIERNSHINIIKKDNIVQNTITPSENLIKRDTKQKIESISYYLNKLTADTSNTNYSRRNKGLKEKKISNQRK